jgi:hypothetical protein
MPAAPAARLGQRKGGGGKGMDDVEQTQQIKSRMLPRLSAEAVMVLLIALFGTLFVHLGFTSTSAYYNAMGFPSALFPQESVLSQITGFLYGVPALVLALSPLIGFLGLMIAGTPWFKRNIAEPVKHSSRSTAPLAASLMITA